MHLLQECEQLQKMYGGHMDERTLEKTQQQHMLYQQEQHHQILHQQIQVLEPGAALWCPSWASCMATDKYGAGPCGIEGRWLSLLE